MNQDHTEMNLSKFHIAFDCPSRSPKANPTLSDVGVLEDTEMSYETVLSKEISVKIINWWQALRIS